MDIKTGAAGSKNLSAYATIPRGSLFVFDVFVDEFRCNETYSSENVSSIVTEELRLFETLKG